MPPWILLIEDNASVAKGLERLLRSVGYACTHVSTARQAQQTLEQRLPRLIVSDVMLPDMSGLDLLKMIRIDPHTRSLPFIVFSASIDPPTSKLLLEAGATSCCSKADVEGLLSLIKDAWGEPEHARDAG